MTADDFRILLAASGLRQKHLAELLGVDVMTVNRWANEGPQHVPAPLSAVNAIRMWTMISPEQKATISLYKKGSSKMAVSPVLEADAEIVRLRTFISDLTYNGIDRGYARWSPLWVEAVRTSAKACGLSKAEIEVITVPWGR